MKNFGIQFLRKFWYSIKKTPGRYEEKFAENVNKISKVGNFIMQAS